MVAFNGRQSISFVVSSLASRLPRLARHVTLLFEAQSIYFVPNCTGPPVIDQFSSNFIYEFILGRSGMGLKMGKFRQINTEF